jgi:large subunit ribosomal protein L6
MSRIGKKLIPIPAEVTVEDTHETVVVRGPKGTLSLELPARYRIVKEEEGMRVEAPAGRGHSALWGTMRALILNNVEGVTKGWEKKLEIEGIGYSARLDNVSLVLQVGFTHPVIIEPPEGIQFTVERNVVTIRGINKQLVGQVAATIRSVRKPEPYKGKGIRYQGEIIRRKAGKRAVGAS